MAPCISSVAVAPSPIWEILLQGEGIALTLDGKTAIKHGITSAAFRSLPDIPINTFDFVLPSGPRSLLSAKGNICSKTLEDAHRACGTERSSHPQEHQGRNYWMPTHPSEAQAPKAWLDAGTC